MSAEFLLKTAAVLEAAAEVIDRHEAEKRAAVKAAFDSSIKEFSAKYVQLTGEELPDDVAEKLAASDETVLAAVKTVFSKTAGAVESLGGSSAESTGDRRPTTKKEAAEAAWSRFGNFITT